MSKKWLKNSDKMPHCIGKVFHGEEQRNVTPTSLPWSSFCCMPLLTTEWSLPFCCLHHSRDSQCLSMGQTNPKIAHYCGGYWPHLIHGSLGTSISPQTVSQSVQPFLHSTSVWTTHRQTHRQRDIHTDHVTCDICSYRLHLMHCMWCGQIIIKIKLLHNCTKMTSSSSAVKPTYTVMRFTTQY